MHAIIISLRQHKTLSGQGPSRFPVESICINYNTHSMSLFDVLVSRGLQAQVVTKRVM